MFLASLIYWRIPTNDNLAKEFFLNSENKEVYFKIVDNETGKEVNKDFHNEFKNRAGYVEMHRLSKPIFDYLSYDIKNNTNNWNIYGITDDVQLHIIGDNPIIFRKPPAKNILETELIFPITKGIFAFHSRGRKLKVFQPKLRVSIDILIYLQSERYVAGPEKSYLNAIKEASKYYDTPEKVEVLKSEIFNSFD